MKTTLLSIITLLYSFQIFGQAIKRDSVIMGQGYANDVYYSFTSPKPKTIESNTNYHFAFSNMISQDDRFYTIWINPLTAKVFVNPTQKTTAWSNYDKTGFDNWRQLQNKDTSWGKGGFAVGNETHPRYAWATYKSNGDLRGDSMYLVQLYNEITQSFDIEYKLWLYQRVSTSGNRTWTFKYGKTDNTWDTTVILNDLQLSKGNFMYYDMLKKQELKREPAAANWDFVFTRYNTFTRGLDYTVTGVLTNYGVSSGAIAGNITDSDIKDSCSIANYSTYINSIGYEWKNFNGTAFELEKNKVRFIQIAKADGKADFYALQFVEFGGSANGKTVFDYAYLGEFKAVSVSSIDSKAIGVYPNPSSKSLTIENTKPISTIKLFDFTGKEINTFNRFENKLDLTELPSGNYLLTAVFTDGTTSQAKITKL